MAPTKRLAARALSMLYRLLAPVIAALEPFAQRSRLPLAPAYAFVSDDTLARLGEYLGAGAQEVRRIVIVGAWHGEEIRPMLERFPHCEILALEPSHEAFAAVSAAFAGESRVRVVQVAAGDRAGTQTFHEMSLTGNGSLLPLAGEGSGTFRVRGVHEKDTYEVRTQRLDALPELSDGAPVDCLWIDVQGYERWVLEGASGLMARVRSAFVEVATDKVTYAGATTFDELYPWFGARGFRLASLGTDPVNGQGNALWLRRDG